jgi:hypothetical protein
MKTLAWFDFVPSANKFWNPYNINDNDDMYFRLSPQWIDWIILILMGLIIEFNTLFKDKEKSDKMVQEATDGMADDFKRTSYYLGRVKRIMKGVLVYSIIIAMCVVQINMQTNLLNWLFFVLNIINVVIMISGAHSRTSLKSQEKIATFIKSFSIIVIVIDIAFVMIIGEFEKTTKEHSIDQ